MEEEKKKKKKEIITVPSATGLKEEKETEDKKGTKKAHLSLFCYSI